MKMQSYKIADLFLNISYAESFSLRECENFAPFRTESSDGINVTVEWEENFRLKKELDKGKLIYENSRTRIVYREKKLWRYEGILPCEEKISWGRCTVYDPVCPDCVQVFFSRKGKIGEDCLLTSAGLSWLLARHNRVLLHASYIVWGQQGIVFTAPSGTGKSTQAELWRRYEKNVEIINGDRCILSLDGGRPVVHSLPLCGTSKIARNRRAPLAAVIILRQGEKNRVKQAGIFQALRTIMPECLMDVWDMQGMGQIMDVLTGILSSIPVYVYECLPDCSAVEKLSDALRKV